jgi:hypothetical protein
MKRKENRMSPGLEIIVRVGGSARFSHMERYGNGRPRTGGTMPGDQRIADRASSEVGGLVKSAEDPDQREDRQRNSQQPKQQIASHSGSPFLIASGMELATERVVPASHYNRNETIHETLFCWPESAEGNLRAPKPTTLEDYGMSQNQNQNQNPNQKPGQQQQGNQPGQQGGQQQGGGQKPGQQQQGGQQDRQGGQ